MHSVTRTFRDATSMRNPKKEDETMSSNHELFERALQRMPGGVNSPVRAFKSVGGEPFFTQRADGPYLWDVEGKRYIDYVGSWGPMIVGHNHPTVRAAVAEAIEHGLSFGTPCPAEVTMAETICALIPSMEVVPRPWRFVPGQGGIGCVDVGHADFARRSSSTGRPDPDPALQ